MVSSGSANSAEWPFSGFRSACLSAKPKCFQRRLASVARWAMIPGTNHPEFRPGDRTPQPYQAKYKSRKNVRNVVVHLKTLCDTCSLRDISKLYRVVAYAFGGVIRLDFRQGWSRLAEDFEDSQCDLAIESIELLWARGGVQSKRSFGGVRTLSPRGPNVHAARLMHAAWKPVEACPRRLFRVARLAL